MPTLETRPHILEGPHATAAPAVGMDGAAGFCLETRVDAKRKEQGASTLGSKVMPSHNENIHLEPRPKPKEAKASQRRIGSFENREPEANNALPELTSAVPAHSAPIDHGPRAPLLPSQPQGKPRVDDIRMTYHPATNKPSVVSHFEEYGQDTPPPCCSSRLKPWLPFCSKTEFAFAELVHKAGMSSMLANKLISIVNTLRDNHFFLKTHGDLDKLWEKAISRHVPFERANIKVPYGSGVQTVEFWSRHFKNWLAMVLANDYVGGAVVLDPTIVEKFNGEDWERVIHEPYMVDRMWEMQSEIPIGDGRVLLITIYADKTCLGATQVAGWLPVIKEEESEKGKPEWVNYKRAVYHKCFKHLFSTIVDDSKFGGVYTVGQRGQFTLFPSIYVLAADFEEQTTMTLTRGVKALFPCTVCMCPQDELSDLDKRHPLRTAEESKLIWVWAQRLTTKAAKERLVKAEASEMWRFAAFPRWKTLLHFEVSPLPQHFADGNNFCDIMKMFIYASHDVLGKNEGMPSWSSKTLEEARQAVQEFGVALKAYEEVLAGTIPGYNNVEDGDDDSDDDIDTRPMEDETESNELKKYKPSLTRAKNLNFPKLHNQVHAIEDIKAKGALHYFSTQYFEGLHRSLKKWYQSQTNFRNIADQILKAECRKITANIIRKLIDDYKKSPDTDDIDKEDIADNQDKDKGSAQDPHTFGNIYLGSREKKTSFNQVEAEHMGRPLFGKLWERSMRKIKELLERTDSPVNVNATHEDVKAAIGAVTKDDPVPTYESLVDWRAHTDYLHAHPTYCKIAGGRFACVIIDSTPRPLFAQLIFVYTVALKIQVNGKQETFQIPLALVQPFKENLKMFKQDKDLGLMRLKLMPEDSARIAPAHSIICGAYIVSEGEGFGTSLIVDVVDTDMFLRLKKLYPVD
ncbi:hypothetical protein B0H34DRAFT_852350 [Crassisporium funariophilum]|nr:hypothetical protein B0H34DRAFT_852350 [Crassisporium funariophilum]